jgi:hypothetical protein
MHQKEHPIQEQNKEMSALVEEQSFESDSDWSSQSFNNQNTIGKLSRKVSSGANIANNVPSVQKRKSTNLSFGSLIRSLTKCKNSNIKFKSKFSKTNLPTFHHQKSAGLIGIK